MLAQNELEYVNAYKECYSVSEVLRIYNDIGRDKLVKILKNYGVYEGLTGKNYLRKKAENYVLTMKSKYGVTNWGQISGGWTEQNKIPYNKIDVLDTKYKAYRIEVEKISKRTLKNLVKPDYCEYTGILFADAEYNPNPNDPRKRSVDHKIPLIICYLNDIDSEIAGARENLVFVLRYVNSIKGNTLHDSFITIAQKIRKVFINEGFKYKEII